MRLCDVLRTAGWLAGTLVPQQAIRALRGRDFNATPSVRDYQLEWADMLSATEESTEVLEPRVTRPVRVSRAADSPAAGERTPDNRPAAGRTFGKAERDQYFAGLTWPEPKRLDDKGRPPGFYTFLEQDYATKHFGFPAGGSHGDGFTACDGGKWQFVTGGDVPVWEAMAYPTDGDPYAEIKAQEKLDRDTQIAHVSEHIRDWVGSLSSVEALATVIVDMLAADKRIAERLDGAK